MTRGSADMLRIVQGVIALRQPVPEGECKAIFADQFGGEPGSVTRELAISASSLVVGRTASLWSQSRPILWDRLRGEYARVEDGAALDALAPAIRAGTAWPALDDCAVFQDQHGTLLFASGSGATTFFYSEHRNSVVFANRPQAIRFARGAPLDRLGVGEIVRFGANYGQRTILRGLKRIPIGHVLDCAADKSPRQRSFVDYSHRPVSHLDEVETREAIGAAIDRNLALIEGPRDLLFSGGVDSALLALRGVENGTVETGWFYAVGPGDSELDPARHSAATIGLHLETVQDRTSPEDIARRIGAYTLPTLDFSILPTFALGAAVLASRGRTTFVDGTGGDAWFGFGSLAHAGTWLSLHRLRAFSPLARRAYCAALPWEELPYLRPIKGLARTPVRPSAALGHMCANPVYSALLDLSAEEWLTVEEEALAVMRSLTGGELGDATSEAIVSDACLIAIAQFAAKTSQWTLAGQAATFYPFLMPNMVAIGRTMPPHLLMRDGQAKPLLKDMVAASALGRDFANRRKSGFQPPLQKLLQDERSREGLMLVREADEGPWTQTAREMPQRLLRDKNSLRIGGLYAIWSRLVIEFWLKSLRQ